MKKVARIFLDNGEQIDIKLGDLFDDDVELIEKHIINNKFFKAYQEYINISHIIKIKIKEEAGE